MVRLRGNIRFALLVISTLAFNSLLGQIDNTFLRDELRISRDSNQAGLSVSALGYMRNTEYFNPIEQGRTLFGYHLHPSLFYQATPNLKVQAGVFLRNDFGGTNPYTRIVPTFTLKVKKNNFSLLFGTLEGALSHRLIEPMFNIERLITNRIENGCQIKYDGPKQFLDVWIDWETFIERGSPFKEVFTAGLSNLTTVYESPSAFKIKVPVQVVAHHHGGQITADSSNMIMQVNAAAGLRISKEYTASFIKELRVDGYYSIYHESTNSGYFPYRSGNGLFCNALVRSKPLDVMLSYWMGSRYLAPVGTYLYQSQSIDSPAHTERNRELVFVRLMREQLLYDNLSLTARFEPVYDLSNDLFDYSFSVYLSYKLDIPF